MKYDIPTARKGNTFDGVSFTMSRNLSPIDLTDAHIKMTITRNNALVLELTEINGLTITDATAGKFKMDALLVTLSEGHYKYEMEFTFRDGSIKTYLKGGWIIVLE